jgi:hypothetical protein
MIVEVIFEEIDEELEADFSEDIMELEADFSEDSMELESDFENLQIVNIAGDPYIGDYAVTPKTEQQILPTKGKTMAEDVTIHPIPIFTVSNTSGGNTVYIAKEM